jgi:carbohydrate kinase (thermoresistant glucokinase family)/Cof subfamily protein (haloacid dehalogenase superfamily)
LSAPTARGLFVSDVDGTLVTPDKTLTPAAIEAAAELRAAGVPYTLVSARPPRGMARVVKAMGVTLPFAAFNGGSLVGPDMKVIEARYLPVDAARQALAALEREGVAAFVFADDAWLVKDLQAPNVDRERRTVDFDPTVVSDFEAVIDRIDKLVAVSLDPPALDGIEAELRASLAGQANIERSQPYYLDLTHSLANKGEAVRRLSALAGFDPVHTVVLGDMTNDVAMFRVAGFSIAMGQSPPAVKAEAKAVSRANTEDGFAFAVHTLVLPRLAGEGRVSDGTTILVAMGVSGSGKSTLGKLLAERLGWTFQEGDDLHPAANVAKMKAGHPLDDADRAPWLAAIGRWIDGQIAKGQSGVITCSALKRAYRDELDGGRPQVRFVFAKLDEATIAERLQRRQGHFFPAQLLASQFADLQPPAADEPVIRVDGKQSEVAQVEGVVEQLQQSEFR